MNKLSIMIDYSEIICGGQYRIRTRVTGLEGQHDIQTTPIAHLIEGFIVQGLWVHNITHVVHPTHLIQLVQTNP